MICASRGRQPKKPASKQVRVVEHRPLSARRPVADAAPRARRPRRASLVAEVRERLDARRTMFRQNSSRPAAPGKRPARPTIAMACGGMLSGASLSRTWRSARSRARAAGWPRPAAPGRRHTRARRSAPASCRRRGLPAARRWCAGRARRAPIRRRTRREAAVQPDEQQRVAADVEEVVVEADAVEAAARPPNRGDAAARPGSSAARRTRARPVSLRVAGPGGGSALRSTLPFGVSGSASSSTTWAGPCTPAAARRARRAPSSAATACPASGTT